MALDQSKWLRSLAVGRFSRVVYIVCPPTVSFVCGPYRIYHHADRSCRHNVVNLPYLSAIGKNTPTKLRCWERLYRVDELQKYTYIDLSRFSRGSLKGGEKERTNDRALLCRQTRNACTFSRATT